LKVFPQDEAVSRIFSISAKEILQARMKECNGQALNSGALAEGFDARYMEFEEFEYRFKECTSKSAIKTRISIHFQLGKHIVERDFYQLLMIILLILFGTAIVKDKRNINFTNPKAEPFEVLYRLHIDNSPLDPAKVKDLRSLCESGITPEQYQQYYFNLFDCGSDNPEVDSDED